MAVAGRLTSQIRQFGRMSVVSFNSLTFSSSQNDDCSVNHSSDLYSQRKKFAVNDVMSHQLPADDEFAYLGRGARAMRTTR
jgi:hypothetical protein